MDKTQLENQDKKLGPDEKVERDPITGARINKEEETTIPVKDEDSESSEDQNE